MSRAYILALLAGLTLTACSAGPMSPGGGGGAYTRADQATQTACRQRASEMYDRRERATIYSANGSSNTPYSANYELGASNRVLSERFSYDQSINECVRNAGTGAVRTGAIPEPSVTRR